MSGTTASAPNTTAAPPHSPTNPTALTGYRISILPAALQISARLATAEELQSLVKILQANAAIWASATKSEP
jgi:hypothetical protein